MVCLCRGRDGGMLWSRRLRSITSLRCPAARAASHPSPARTCCRPRRTGCIPAPVEHLSGLGLLRGTWPRRPVQTHDGEGTGGVCALHSSHGGRDGLRPFPKLAGWDKTLPKGFLGMLLSLFFKACSRSEPVNCKYIRQNPADSNLSDKLQIVGNYIFML